MCKRGGLATTLRDLSVVPATGPVPVCRPGPSSRTPSRTSLVARIYMYKDCTHRGAAKPHACEQLRVRSRFIVEVARVALLLAVSDKRKFSFASCVKATTRARTPPAGKYTAQSSSQNVTCLGAVTLSLKS